MPGCSSCCFFPNLCLPSLQPVVKREQNNLVITELVSVRLKLFYVFVPTKCCVLPNRKSSSRWMLLKSLEKVGPEMSFNIWTVNWGKGKNEW